MGGWRDEDLSPPLRLPEGFCGMEGVEQQVQLEKEALYPSSDTSTNLHNASVPELLREVARKLEKKDS